ncbi:S-adenosylmethionine decarboxylase proenzyme [bacterium]|nr:S-adenosylmethionine decarboxylase proenzyme [bacterium]
MAVTAPFEVEQEGKKHYHLGQHVLAEFFECNPNILNNLEKVEQLMVEAALECGATIVQKCFHRFNPYGISGVVIIAESHLAIHTWPELGYAAVDLFTCGSKCDPTVAFEYLRKCFASKSSSYTALKRGIIDEETSSVAHLPFELVEHKSSVA